MYDTSEMFSWYYVDPIIAQKHVPPKWKVKVNKNGMASLYLLVQKCDKMVLNKILNVGSVGMSHIWIELEGPLEVVTPFKGTTRSLPTWYWYILPHQLENKLATLMFNIAGIAAQSIQEVSLGGKPGSIRYGKIIEEDSPEIGYTWNEKSQLYSKPDIVTGSHRIYRKYGLRESEAHVKCLTHFIGEGNVNLTASPDSAIGKLGFGTTLNGFCNTVLVKHCQVIYRLSFFN